MKVEQLNLANFRGFEQIELTFEEDVNVIAGVNGVGKSGILQALTILLSHILREVTPSRSKALNFVDDDIREGQNGLITSASLLMDSRALDVSVQHSRIAPNVADSARERLNALRARRSGAVDDEERLRKWQEEEHYLLNLLRESEQAANISLTSVKTAQDRAGEQETAASTEQQIKKQLRQRSNQPLALFFSPHRSLVKELRTLPRSTPLRLASAYQNALENRPLDLRHFVHWYRVQEALRADPGGRRREILETLQRVVTACMPECKALRVETKPSVRFVVEKSGVPLALNQLSDGERGLLAVIFDITRRLAIANPELDDPIAEGKAIILLDEIELHLHPTWQRQVLRRFTDTFTNCQFIVTTHSPQVLGEVESRCIRYLLHEDDTIIAWTPPRSFGLDASRVLEEIMDATARNAEIDRALRALFESIDDENFEAANRHIAALRQRLGENDPELTRALALMAFLKGVE